ncbi:uncharacterized protein LOC133187606 [Saccostrea echinata]|uniref:uncharacterized protein LOC133187606 n=1 Tax=Saccostrea echinata TaxID=191078 RepID=UPI002A80BAB2|nr:uncharacterized protein LOC133187606 [Saccostrea echinata]
MSRPKRNPNFTTAEISMLTEEVEKRKDVIFSRQNSSVTNQAKKGEWDLICEKVNAVNTSHLRTADKLKKKWSVLCSETKKKISKLKQEQVRTGCGQLPADCSVTPVEDKIQSIIGETAISGVDGGIDTLEEVSYGMAGKGALIIPAADQSLEGSTDTIATCRSTTSNRQTSTEGAKKCKVDVKTPSLDLIDVEKTGNRKKET